MATPTNLIKTIEDTAKLNENPVKETSEIIGEIETS
jgi:hypothetical protein